MRTSHLELSVTDTLSSCGSLCLSPLLLEGASMMLAEQDTDLEESRPLLKAILLMSSFSRQQYLDLPKVVSDYWPSKQSRVWVPSHGIDHKSNQILTDYSHKSCATIALTHLAFKSPLQIQIINVCSWMYAYFSPLMTCAVPSDPMNTRRYG